MKILCNTHSQKYLPILIEDTSDMDKVIDTFEEWIKNFENEKLLELDDWLIEGQYSVSEEFEGFISIVIYREDEHTRYVSSYDFELKDLSIIETKVSELLNERAVFVADMTKDEFYFKVPATFDAKPLYIEKKWKETQCRNLIFNGNDIGMLLSDKNVQSIRLIDDIKAFDLLEKDADDEKLDNVTSGGPELSYFGPDYIGTIDYGLYAGQMDYDQVTGVVVWYYDGTEIFINKNFKKEITMYK